MFSMLDGDALTAVEHLEFAAFAVDGGETLIFNILEARYSDKDPIDRAGKALFDVFEVSAREGDRLSEWSARAESVFHACQRDAGIAFPDMVTGHLCLHRCGLSDDTRVVVLGRTGGKYEIASIAPALRSCFSEFPECLCQKCRLKRKKRRRMMKKRALMSGSCGKFINEDDE